MENSSIDMTKDENDNEKHIAILPIDDPIKFSGISPLKKVELSKENRPLRISIEGNIGAGKSTCIQYFSKLENVEAYAEPIEAWRNVDGENLFELHFKDMNKWVEVF
ncbi:hypothetical protein HHI36_014139 [Cryptolaemus montrouzieri]|uniref:Deoxynucleoside kinase domain-containing protein n=1 Tax=Cryptolaemus montrouzieri TaxID=559131 RepID=A0ABD2N2N9_9CUCU